MPFQTIIDAFSKTADNNEKPALIFGNTTLSYSMLQQKVDELSKHFATLNFGDKPRRLALDMQPGIEYIVSILAAMQSGIEFLPLNKNLNEQDFHRCLNDCDIHHVLSDDHRNIKIPEGIKTHSYKKFESEKLAGEPFKKEISPDDFAYIIYTSGSTGEPKAVHIRHEGFESRIQSMINFLDVKENDVYAQFCPLEFDASLQEIFTALLSGATLKIIPEDIRTKFQSLAKAYDDVTITTWVPSVFKNLSPSAFKKIRIILTTGGKAAQEDIKKWIMENPGLRFCNGYGSTEETIGCMLAWINENQDSILNMGLGKPMDDVKLFFRELDDENNAIEPIITQEKIEEGKRYELITGGFGVNNQYLGKQEGFVKLSKDNKDNYQTDPAGTITAYLTRDVVSLNNEKQIECIGRLGRSVKRHGVLIDLEELQKCLNDIKASCNIKDCHVLADGPHLIVYFIKENEDLPAYTEHLTNLINQKLSLWQCTPSHYLEWDAKEFPKSSTKKTIDEKELRCHLEQNLNKSLKEAVEPTDAVEKKIVDIWTTLFKKRNLACPALTLQSNFLHFLPESLAFGEMITEVTHAFKDSFGRNEEDFFNLTLHEFRNDATIARLGRIVREYLTKEYLDSKPAEKPILSYTGNPDNPINILIHTLSGDAKGDYDRPEFSTQLGQNTESSVYTISANQQGQAPSSVEEFAKLYLHKIRKLLRETKKTHFNLIGWSAGGVIAQEIQRQWKKEWGTLTTIMIDSLCPTEWQKMSNENFCQFLIEVPKKLGLNFNSSEIFQKAHQHKEKYIQLQLLCDRLKDEHPEKTAIINGILTGILDHQPKFQSNQETFLIRAADPEVLGIKDKEHLGWPQEVTDLGAITGCDHSTIITKPASQKKLIETIAPIIRQENVRHQLRPVIEKIKNAYLSRERKEFYISPHFIELKKQQQDLLAPSSNELSLNKMCGFLKEKPKHYIDGAPGSGKTSLQQELARLWALGESLDSFDLVFEIPANFFIDHPEARKNKTLFLEACLSRYELAALEKESILKSIESNAGPSILFLIDEEKDLPFFNQIKNSYFVFTGNNAGSSSDFEIAPLSKEEIKHYLIQKTGRDYEGFLEGETGQQLTNPELLEQISEVPDVLKTTTNLSKFRTDLQTATFVEMLKARYDYTRTLLGSDADRLQHPIINFLNGLVTQNNGKEKYTEKELTESLARVKDELKKNIEDLSENLKIEGKKEICRKMDGDLLDFLIKTKYIKKNASNDYALYRQLDDAYYRARPYIESLQEETHSPLTPPITVLLFAIEICLTNQLTIHEQKENLNKQLKKIAILREEKGGYVAQKIREFRHNEDHFDPKKIITCLKEKLKQQDLEPRIALMRCIEKIEQECEASEFLKEKFNFTQDEKEEVLTFIRRHLLRGHLYRHNYSRPLISALRACPRLTEALDKGDNLRKQEQKKLSFIKQSIQNEFDNPAKLSAFIFDTQQKIEQRQLALDYFIQAHCQDPCFWTTLTQVLKKPDLTLALPKIRSITKETSPQPSRKEFFLKWLDREEDKNSILILINREAILSNSEFFEKLLDILDDLSEMSFYQLLGSLGLEDCRQLSENIMSNPATDTNPESVIDKLSEHKRMLLLKFVRGQQEWAAQNSALFNDSLYDKIFNALTRWLAQQEDNDDNLYIKLCRTILLGYEPAPAPAPAAPGLADISTLVKDKITKIILSRFTSSINTPKDPITAILNQPMTRDALYVGCEISKSGAISSDQKKRLHEKIIAYLLKNENDGLSLLTLLELNHFDTSVALTDENKDDLRTAIRNQASVPIMTLFELRKKGFFKDELLDFLTLEIDNKESFSFMDLFLISSTNLSQSPITRSRLEEQLATDEDYTKTALIIDIIKPELNALLELLKTTQNDLKLSTLLIKALELYPAKEASIRTTLEENSAWHALKKSLEKTNYEILPEIQGLIIDHQKPYSSLIDLLSQKLKKTSEELIKTLNQVTIIDDSSDYGSDDDAHSDSSEIEAEDPEADETRRTWESKISFWMSNPFTSSPRKKEMQHICNTLKINIALISNDEDSAYYSAPDNEHRETVFIFKNRLYHYFNAESTDPENSIKNIQGLKKETVVLHELITNKLHAFINQTAPQDPTIEPGSTAPKKQQAFLNRARALYHKTCQENANWFKQPLIEESEGMLAKKIKSPHFATAVSAAIELVLSNKTEVHRNDLIIIFKKCLQQEIQAVFRSPQYLKTMSFFNDLFRAEGRNFFMPPITQDLKEAFKATMESPLHLFSHIVLDVLENPEQSSAQAYLLSLITNNSAHIIVSGLEYLAFLEGYEARTREALKNLLSHDHPAIRTMAMQRLTGKVNMNEHPEILREVEYLLDDADMNTRLSTALQLAYLKDAKLEKEITTELHSHLNEPTIKSAVLRALANWPSQKDFVITESIELMTQTNEGNRLSAIQFAFDIISISQTSDEATINKLREAYLKQAPIQSLTPEEQDADNKILGIIASNKRPSPASSLLFPPADSGKPSTETGKGHKKKKK